MHLPILIKFWLKKKCELYRKLYSIHVLLCLPSKKEGSFALVGLSVHRQFPFIFFTKVTHTEMKFGIYKNTYM